MASQRLVLASVSKKFPASRSIFKVFHFQGPCFGDYQKKTKPCQGDCDEVGIHLQFASITTLCQGHTTSLVTLHNLLFIRGPPKYFHISISVPDGAIKPFGSHCN